MSGGYVQVRWACPGGGWVCPGGGYVWGVCPGGGYPPLPPPPTDTQWRPSDAFTLADLMLSGETLDLDLNLEFQSM